MLGREQTSAPGVLSRRKASAMVERAVRALRPRGRSRRPGRGAAGRRPAAGRDHQGALQRGQGADPRRAHRGADAPGDRRAHGHHALAQGAGHLDHLHHPQAARGQGGRRPDLGDPPRQGGRHRPAQHVRGGARRDDGGSRGASSRSTRTPPNTGARGHVGRGLHRGRPARPPGRQGRLVRGPRRRGARHRGRPGQRPDRADQGAARAGQARCRRDPPRRRRHQQARPAREPRRRHRLHPRGPLPRRLRRGVQRRARTSSSTSTAATSSRSGLALKLDDIADNADAPDRGVRHPHRVGLDAGARPSRAATSRRSWWPGSSRGRSRC